MGYAPGMRTSLLVLSSVVLSLLGCENKVTIEDGSGGTTSTSTSSKNTATSGTGQSTSATGGLCSGFEDAQPGEKLVVRIHNESGIPIYLPTACSKPMFDIQPLGEPPPNLTYVYSDFCLQTCQDRQTQGQIDCAPCAPQAILLQPGQIREFEWDRTALDNGVTMPAGCYFGSPDSTCAQIVTAHAGEYYALATGYAECGDPGVGCACDPQTGVCDGAAFGGQAYSDVGKFTHPGSNSVDVVFGVCAFPCPGQ